MTSEPMGKKYHVVAMAFHWIIAIPVLFMLWFGHYVEDLPKGSFDRLEGFQMHYSIGLTILILTLGRIIWRMIHPAPPMVPTMKRIEVIFAKSIHHLFYILLLGLPLAGWATASTSRLNVPIRFFDLFQVPWFPFVRGGEGQQAVHEFFEFIHVNLGWVMLGLFILHFAAVMRHALILKDGTLRRMIPGK